MPKFVFIVGGVMSSVGKGVATASTAKILQSRGYNVTCVKIDPYINVDAGTMNPVEHGEVFVTEDGDETDQDIGNYERFLNRNIYSYNYMTTGRVYLSVIEKERNLEYKGKCVEVVPHIPEEVIRRIKIAQEKNNADIVIIEIGGTVGEYQNLLFLEAARMMKMQNPQDVMFVMVSFMPIPSVIGEMKTKPTQFAVRSLNSAGIQPDILLCRGAKPLDEPRKEKLGIFCNVVKDNIISAPDVECIYEIPINFEKDHYGDRILDILKLESYKNKIEDHESFEEWVNSVDKIKKITKTVKIGIIGKYFTTGDFVLKDSYISVIEAIKHAAWYYNINPQIDWIDSTIYEQDISLLEGLSKYNGIIIPGGFGSRGVNGKINAIKYIREHDIPFLGLCYGMQLATIEFARDVCGLYDANTEEIDSSTKNPVIHIMESQKENIAIKKFGGSMRLGAYPCKLNKNSICYTLYNTELISERHRHRYEFNNTYRDLFEKNGLLIAGTSPDNSLVEIIELKDHKFFIGTQFHPELKSRFLDPHPIFKGFIKSMI
ncbi:MAG TPA: CTP synthase [bacterium]|nr:CTP synthase [bacterium]